MPAFTAQRTSPALLSIPSAFGRFIPLAERVQADDLESAR
jgi:hypothetical protein